MFRWIQLNSGKVVAVGPGERDKDGKLIPVALKEGDTVLLPEYGGLEVKLAAEKEYVNYLSIASFVSENVPFGILLGQCNYHSLHTIIDDRSCSALMVQ